MGEIGSVEAAERAAAELVKAAEAPGAVEEVVLSGEFPVKRAGVPEAFQTVYEFMWDPVRGVHRVKRDGGVERLREPGLIWRDPMKASQSRTVRVLLLPQGQLACGVKNKWNKWVVQGLGVVDPVAYAEVVKPQVFDFPWLKK